MTTNSEENKRKIFLVEGDSYYIDLCTEWLVQESRLRGLNTEISHLSAGNLNGAISNGNPNLIVLNCWGDRGAYSDSEVLDFLSRIRDARADAKVYLLGCDNDTGTKALNLGAVGYSSNPYPFISPEKLAESLVGKLG